MSIPNHVAIILDGNGRWAKSRMLPRSMGHYHGGRNLFKIANSAHNLGIKILSVYAFSTENWSRPEQEVKYLMTKPVEMFKKEAKKLKDVKYRIQFIGRKDRIPKALMDVMHEMEIMTQLNTEMTLNICFDYGAYDEIIHAIKQIEGEVTEEKLQANLMISSPVDLLIRTSGEMRISNFLLWQCAYAEFYFTDEYWPAFNKKSLEKALLEFESRSRRFGKL